MSFDVFLKSYPLEKRAFFRITNTTEHVGNQGDRIVRMYVSKENYFRFHFALGDNPNYLFQTNFTMTEQTWHNITVKQSNVSGTFKLQIFINDSMIHEVDNPSPNVFHDAIAYASDPHWRPVDGTLINLRILPGTLHFSSIWNTLLR